MTFTGQKMNILYYLALKQLNTKFSDCIANVLIGFREVEFVELSAGVADICCCNFQCVCVCVCVCVIVKI